MIGTRRLWLLLLALSVAVLVGGCASGIGSLVGAGLFALALLLHGCESNENCRDYTVCVDGEFTVEHLCCPSGTECNYGQAPDRTCGDGSCVPFGELCPGETPDAGRNDGTDAGRDGGESCFDDADAGSESCGDAG